MISEYVQGTFGYVTELFFLGSFEIRQKQQIDFFVARKRSLEISGEILISTGHWARKIGSL